MSIASNDELLAALLSQQPRKRRGCIAQAIEFACTAAVVALAVCGGYFLLEIYAAAPVAPQGVPIGTPDSDRSLSLSPIPPPRQQPVYVPAPALPDCATVQDTTTACEQELGNTMLPNSPTPTAEPTPTEQTGFWTQEELAAFTATAEAFYQPETLPTVEPAFATAVQQGCEDAAKRAQSPLLDSWCKPLDQ